MKIKKLDEKTVQYFVGELRFLSIGDKFHFENGQKTDKKIGSVIECIALKFAASRMVFEVYKKWTIIFEKS